eukprot:732420-Prorocentrum_minimum.AAC.1
MLSCFIRYWLLHRIFPHLVHCVVDIRFDDPSAFTPEIPGVPLSTFPHFRFRSEAPLPSGAAPASSSSSSGGSGTGVPYISTTRSRFRFPPDPLGPGVGCCPLGLLPPRPPVEVNFSLKVVAPTRPATRPPGSPGVAAGASVCPSLTRTLAGGRRCRCGELCQ